MSGHSIDLPSSPSHGMERGPDLHAVAAYNLAAELLVRFGKPAKGPAGEGDNPTLVVNLDRDHLKHWIGTLNTLVIRGRDGAVDIHWGHDFDAPVATSKSDDEAYVYTGRAILTPRDGMISVEYRFVTIDKSTVGALRDSSELYTSTTPLSPYAVREAQRLTNYTNSAALTSQLPDMLRRAANALHYDGLPQETAMQAIPFEDFPHLF